MWHRSRNPVGPIFKIRAESVHCSTSLLYHTVQALSSQAGLLHWPPCYCSGPPLLKELLGCWSNLWLLQQAQIIAVDPHHCVIVVAPGYCRNPNYYSRCLTALLFSHHCSSSVSSDHCSQHDSVKP